MNEQSRALQNSEMYLQSILSQLSQFTMSKHTVKIRTILVISDEETVLLCFYSFILTGWRWVELVWKKVMPRTDLNLNVMAVGWLFTYIGWKMPPSINSDLTTPTS